MKKNKLLAGLLAVSLLVGMAVPAFAEGEAGAVVEPPASNPTAPAEPSNAEIRPVFRENLEGDAVEYVEGYAKFLVAKSEANKLTVAVDSWAIENLEKKLETENDDTKSLDGMPDGLIPVVDGEALNNAYVGVKFPTPVIETKTFGAVSVNGGALMKLDDNGGEGKDFGGGGTDTMTGALIDYVPFAKWTGTAWQAVDRRTFTYDLKWYDEYPTGDNTPTVLATSKVTVEVNLQPTAKAQLGDVKVRPDKDKNEQYATNYPNYVSATLTTDKVTVSPFLDKLNGAGSDKYIPADNLIAFKYDGKEYLTYGVAITKPTDADAFKVSCTSNALMKWDEITKAKLKDGSDLPYVGSKDPIAFTEGSQFIRENYVGDVVGNDFYQYIPVAQRAANSSDKWEAMPAATYNLNFKWYKEGKAAGTTVLPIEVKGAPANATSIEIAAPSQKVKTKASAKLNLDYIFKPTVMPSNATVKDIVWSIVESEPNKSGNTYAIEGKNVLTVGADAKQINLKATVTNPNGIKVEKNVDITTEFPEATVTVNLPENAGANGVKVVITTGKEISITSGAKTGNVSNVPYGTYNVIAYNHDTLANSTKTVTAKLVVDAETETITMPAFPADPIKVTPPTVTDTGSTGVTVPVIENVTNVVAGGATVKDSAGEDVKLPDTDKIAKIEIDTTVAATVVDDSKTDEKKILEKIAEAPNAEEIVPVVTLDIKTEMTVTGKDGGDNIDKTAISQTLAPITFTVALPAALQEEGAEFTVYRVHGDDVAALPTSYNSAENTITFSSDKFSTFMIVQGKPKADTPITPAPDQTPSYRPSYGGGSSTPTTTPSTDLTTISENTAISANTAKGTKVEVPSSISDPTFDSKEIALNAPEAKAFVDTAANAGFAFAKVFQMNLFDGKTKVTKVEDGKVKISIPFAGKAGYDYVVLRYETNGGITAMPALYKDGQITFTTNHFSLYAIAVKSTNKNLFADTTVKPGTPESGTTTVPQTSACTLTKLF